jgi:hypothetical protein
MEGTANSDAILDREGIVSRGIVRSECFDLPDPTPVICCNAVGKIPPLSEAIMSLQATSMVEELFLYWVILALRR